MGAQEGKSDMKRIDTEEDHFWKVCITGDGGTGKTSMGVSAPRPLVLLSERQGLSHIRQAAKRQGKPMPPVLMIEDFEDYRTALRALRGPKDKPFVIHDGKDVVLELPPEEWPQTVVIDSLSDACDVLKKELVQQMGKLPVGSDGLPVLSMRYWGVLIERTEQMIKGFRDLPMHVVFLCLLSDKTREVGGVTERTVQPQLSTASMANKLCAAVNVMGYTYRRFDEAGKAVYAVATVGSEGTLTKPCEPLRPREVPDLTNWISRLNGSLDDVPEMPLPPAEMEAVPAKPEVPKGRETKLNPCTQCGTMMATDDANALCLDCEAKAFGPSGRHIEERIQEEETHS